MVPLRKVRWADTVLELGLGNLVRQPGTTKNYQLNQDEYIHTFRAHQMSGSQLTVSNQLFDF